MVNEFIQAFVLVFAAEMGDKSQLIAMTFATQYKTSQVLMGVFLGAFLNHGLAILFGRLLSTLIPINKIQLIAGVIFILFGYFTLLEEEEEEIKNKNRINPLLTVAVAFFVGELGDKTQLTAIALSSEGEYPLIILLATTLAMVSTSALGILIGSKIGDKIKENYIKVGSSIIFILFGCFKILISLPDYYITIKLIMIFIIIIAIELILIKKYLERYEKKIEKTQMQIVSQKLFNQTERLTKSLDSICLGTDRCGECSGKECLVGYVKYLLKDARDNSKYYNNISIDENRFISKSYDEDQVCEALALIVNDYLEYKWDFKDDFVVNQIRKLLEKELLGLSIDQISSEKEYINQIKLYNFDLGLKIKTKLDMIK